MTLRTPVYVGGPNVSVYVCSASYRRWHDQRHCEGSVKNPDRDRCWYCNSDGVCDKIRMENEEYQKTLTK